MQESNVIIREAGTITEIRQGIVKLSGLPGCVVGQLIELGPETEGFVLGFTESEVLALILGSETRRPGGRRGEVRQQPRRLLVGPQLLGRVVSPLGEPLDGEPRPI